MRVTYLGSGSGPYGGEVYTTGAPTLEYKIEGHGSMSVSQLEVFFGTSASFFCTIRTPSGSTFPCGVSAAGSGVHGLAAMHFGVHSGLEAPRTSGDPPDPRTVDVGGDVTNDHGETGKSWSLDLSFVITLQLEEIFEVLRGNTFTSAFASTLDAPPFESGPDGPYRARGIIYHRILPGSTVHVEATGTVTEISTFDYGVVTTTTTPVGLTVDDVCTLDDCFIFPDADGVRGVEQPTAGLGGSLFYSHGGLGYGADTGAAGGGTLYATLNGNPMQIDMSDTLGDSSSAAGITTVRHVDPHTGLLGGSIAGFVQIPRKAELDVRVRPMNGAYPDAPLKLFWGGANDLGAVAGAGSQPYTLLTSDSGANWHDHFTQQYVSVTSDDGTAVHINTIARAKCTLEQATLFAREGISDNRMLLRGLRWTAMRLLHTQSQPLDSIIDNAGWSASSGATVLSDGTKLTITIPAGGGSVTRTAQSGDAVAVQPDPGVGTKYQSWEAWRWVRLRVKSVGAGQTIRIWAANAYATWYEADAWPGTQPILTKYWDRVTGAAGTVTDILIDLMSPDGMQDAGGTPITLPLADLKDSHFPTLTGDGPYSGVTFVASFGFSNLAGSETYTITGLDFITLTWPYVESLPANLAPTYSFGAPEPYSQVGLLTPFVQPYVVRGLLARTDGRQSLELYYKSAVNDPLITAFDYTDRTITEWVSDINLRPGWAATVDATLQPSDGYHGNGLPAADLDNGGTLIDVAMDALGRLDMTAAAHWDEISWNPFMSGAVGLGPGVLNVAVLKVLRGRGSGMLIDSTTGMGVAGEVVMTAQAGVDAGHGASDTTGLYLTGGPYGRGYRADTVHTVESYSATRKWFTRKSNQVSFRASFIPTGAPWILEHSTGLHMVDIFEGDAYYWHGHFETPPWDDVLRRRVTAVGDVSDARMAMIDPRRVILLYDTAGGDIYEVASVDDGVTWSDPVARFAGAHRPTIWVAENRVVIRAARIGTALRATVQQSGDDDPSAEFSLCDASGSALSATDDRYHLRWREGRWYLHVRLTGESSTSLWMAVDEGDAPDTGAMTFSRQDGWGIPGGMHPTLAVDRSGDLYLGSYLTGNILLQGAAPGDDPGAPTGLTYADGTLITVKDDVFGLDFAQQGPRRAVIAAVLTGETSPSVWSSLDAVSWTRSVS